MSHHGEGPYVTGDYTSAEITEQALRHKIEALEAKNTRLKQEWFQKGRESVLRDNRSGCCCKFDENEEELLEPCGAHKKWLKDNISRLNRENAALLKELKAALEQNGPRIRAAIARVKALE